MENSRENSVKFDSDKNVYVNCQRKLETEITFTVANISNLKKEVRSPAIKVGLFSWQISVESSFSHGSNLLEAYLNCSSENDDKSWNCIAEYELVMVNLNNLKESDTKKPANPRKFTSENPAWGYEFGTISELEKGFMDVKGSVIFQAKIKTEGPDGFECKMPCTLMKLSEGFSDANINPSTSNYKLTDVVLCIDNHKIHCHRFILAMASKVFEKMFTTDMNESNSKEVSIKEIEVETLKSLLMFVYQHKIDSDKINVKLLAIADMYEVLCLKKICSTHLSKILSIKNVAEIWFTAYLHNIEDLAHDAIVWMARNWTILKEDKCFWKWAKEHPDLPLEIVTFLSAECKIDT